MIKSLKYCLILGFVVVQISLQSQSDSINFKRRKIITLSTGIGGTVLTHAGLYQLWYKDYPHSKFHFINDNQHWEKMDKLGHQYSAYYLSVVGTESMRWAGYERKKAIWYGGLFGLIFQHPIEFFDGFSKEWGASVGDLVANTMGSALCISQNLLWNEQRMFLKYSFQPSNYAAIRPNTLGAGITQEFLKDYNGQTYWLSVFPNLFYKDKDKWYQQFGLSLGYGANGMIGGTINTWKDSKTGNLIDRTDIKRYNQFYLSADYNWTKLKVKKKWLKKCMVVLNCIKMPLPAIEFNTLNKVRFHGLGF